jgi:photosystem II stability/assembly factor-like uncharacterized protein
VAVRVPRGPESTPPALPPSAVHTRSRSPARSVAASAVTAPAHTRAADPCESPDRAPPVPLLRPESPICDDNRIIPAPGPTVGVCTGAPPHDSASATWPRALFVSDNSCFYPFDYGNPTSGITYPFAGLANPSRVAKLLVQFASLCVTDIALLRTFLSDKITCVIKKLGLFYLLGLLIPPLEYSWSQEVTLDYDPALRATASRKSFERMSIEWPATPGSYYQIQSTPRLMGVSWTNFGNTLGPSTDRMTKEIHLESVSETYFRIMHTAAVLFSDDFETSGMSNWSIMDGTGQLPNSPVWQVRAESDGNQAFYGSGHNWANLVERHAWTDFSVRFRVKLVAGSVHFNYRYNEKGRYFIGFNEWSSGLSKQYWPDTFFPGLVTSFTHNATNVWHTVEIAGAGAVIRMRVDGVERWSYTDSEPLTSGTIAFECLDNSSVYLDDITVIGPPPRVPDPRFTWVRTGGPLGGIGYDVRIDPTDPQVLYVTDSFSGVSKSTNGGISWVPMNRGIISRTGSTGDAIPVFCLTIDPRNPQVLWCGTQSMRGVYKSVDGATNWIKSDQGIPDLSGITFRSFTIDPSNSDIVYAGTEVPTTHLGPDGQNEVRGKLFRTTDGGSNWTEVLDCGALIRWVCINPNDTRILYAATGIFDRDEAQPEGVLKSTDAGRTWRNINRGLPNPTVGGLVMDPRNPMVLYASTGRHSGFGGGPTAQNGGIYKTTDGGETWIESFHPNDHTPVTAIALAPSNPDLVYATFGHGNILYRSIDGGTIWRTIGIMPDGAYTGIPISLAVDPVDAQIIYLNSYIGGVFKSTDGGVTWHVSSQGYTGAQLSDVGIDPVRPSHIYAAGRLGMALSTNSGDSWNYVAAAMGENNIAEAGALSVNPNDALDAMMASGFNATIVRTLDGGRSWRRVYDTGIPGIGDPNHRHGVVRFARCLMNPRVIFAACRIPAVSIPSPSLGVLISQDGGDHWVRRTNGLIADLNISTVAVHPSNPEVAYAGTWNGAVYYTSNGGIRWEPCGAQFTTDVRSLAIDPINPQVIYAGTEMDGLFHSMDAGQTWKPIGTGLEPNASVHALVINPTRPEIVWLADFRSGVYRSTDHGGTWVPVNQGLTMRAVNALSISADGKVLYAATDGGGVFRLGPLPD